MAQSTKTVLIVDRDPAMCYYHALLLMRLQYLAMTARTSVEALMRMRGSAPSLILTVVSSASDEGMDFIRTLKESENTRAIPVIALADKRNEKLISSCRKIGCVDCIVQPADPHQLYRLIQSVTEATPRMYIRINLALKAVLEEDSSSGNEKEVAYTSTISEGGCSMRTHTPLQKNSLNPVRIAVKDREINTRAEVVYHLAPDPRRNQGPGMGFKFVDIADDDRIFLRGFIKDHLVHDIIPQKGRNA